MAKKEGAGIVSYVFGIASIVMAFFNSPAGLAFGFIGLIQSKKEKSELSKKGRKLSIWGIVLSAIFLIISIAVTIYYVLSGAGTLPTFPV